MRVFVCVCVCVCVCLCSSVCVCVCFGSQAEDKEKAERMFFDVGQAYEVLSDPGMVCGVVWWTCVCACVV